VTANPQQTQSTIRTKRAINTAARANVLPSDPALARPRIVGTDPVDNHGERA
jgi:hypothetical protein